MIKANYPSGLAMNSWTDRNKSALGEGEIRRKLEEVGFLEVLANNHVEWGRRTVVENCGFMNLEPDFKGR